MATRLPKWIVPLVVVALLAAGCGDGVERFVVGDRPVSARDLRFIVRDISGVCYTADFNDGYTEIKSLEIIDCASLSRQW